MSQYLHFLVEIVEDSFLEDEDEEDEVCEDLRVFFMLCTSAGVDCIVETRLAVASAALHLSIQSSRVSFLTASRSFWVSLHCSPIII